MTPTEPVTAFTPLPVARPLRWPAVLYGRRRVVNALALAAGDTLAFVAALLLAGEVRLWLLGAPLIPPWALLIFPAWGLGALLFHLLPSWGLGTIQELRRITLMILLVYAGMTTLLFVTQQADNVSRLTVTISLAASLLLVPLVRLRVKRLLIRYNLWGLPTVVYGAGDIGTQVVRFLQTERGIGYQPVGLFDDDPQRLNTSVEDLPVLGPTTHVATNVPVAILAMPRLPRTRLIELLEGPLASYRSVLVIPDLLEMPSLWVVPRDLNGVLALELTSNLLNPLSRLLKRTVDLTLVGLSAVLWVPLCGLIAFLIVLEDGASPLFAQHRVGKRGRAFRAYKFRTMVPDAEAVLQDILARDEALRIEWTTSFKLRKDPRLTRIGRLLRRFSLDELPQLWNVLRGDMSLVGPRPLPPYHHDILPERLRNLRERVGPGLTGLWQVSGRSDAGTEGMEQWDAYYVRNWSLWLDAVVLIRTGRAVLHGTGAY